MPEPAASNSGEAIRGPIPLGRDLHSAEPGTWPWLSAIRGRKIAPFATRADRVLDFSVDAGWNICNAICHEKIACWNQGSPEKGNLPPEVNLVASLEELEAGTVDLIVSHHSLGLFMDPHAVLSELRAKLKPNGRVVVFVPAETERSLKELQAEQSSRWFYTWTVQTLANLLGEAGFEFVESKVTRLGSEVFALRQLRRYGGGEKGFHFWRKVGWWVEPFGEVCVVARRV